MKKRKRDKNFIRNRSGGRRVKLPGRLLSLMCALILVLSTVFLDIGHISQAYASDDEFILDTESEDTEEAGVEAQSEDTGEPTEDSSEISTELSDDSSEDSNEVITEEAGDASAADFSSGDNLSEQELTTEDSAEDPQTVTYTKLISDDTVEVKAEAPEGALPEGAELVVRPITNNADDTEEAAQYAEVENKLIQQAKDNEQDLQGFLAYDISFVDADGQKVEPTADVKVSMEYREAAVPEEVIDAVTTETEENSEEIASPEANTKVEILHFVEDQNGEVQNIVNMTEEGQANVETTSDGQVQKAEFNTGSFSVFTITWTRKNTSTGETFSFSSNINMVKKSNNTYVDMTAKVNDGALTLETEDTNPVLYMSSISSSGPNKSLYSVTEDGKTYRFAGAYLATLSRGSYTLVNGDNNTPQKITKLMGRKEANSNSYVMKYQYKGDTAYRDLQNGQRVVFVYTDAALTTSAGLYSESGTQLYIGNNTSNNTVNLSSLTDVLDTKTATGDPIPKQAKESQDVSYEYLRTVVGTGDESTEVKYLRKGDFGLQYSEDGETWIDVGSNPVKFVYGLKDTEKSAIATADTKGLIDIDLINYNREKIYDSNFNGDFKCSNGGSKRYTNFRFGYNHGEWTGSSAVTQGLVKSNLGSDGYPVLSNGTSLNQLFNGTWNQTVSGSYSTGLNHLFSYNEKTGEYSYDSDTNYAYYDISSKNTEKNFVVYNQKNYKGSEGNWKKGAFMPFSSWTDTNKTNKYAFGMRVAFDFMQPKGGQINGKDMEFTFSGDDDVWVFVDGKLVLDLGGIHDRSSGIINFRTGDVWINVDPTKPIEQRGTPSTTLQKIFGSTFSDYSSHTLSFFYLERGEGESNCSLRFNLPPRPTNSIEIAKKLENSDKEKYTNADFQFKAYLEDDEDRSPNDEDRDPQSVQYNAIAEGTPFKVKKDGVLTGETRYVGEHNIFTLKAGESAVFEGIDSGLYFYAEEVGILSDQFDKVDITGWNVTYKNTDGQDTGTTEGKVTDGQTYLAKSEEKTAGNAAKVEFSNTCNVRNLRKLQITKKIKDDMETSDTFSFRVYLSGQNGQLIPYDGSYKVQDQNGTQLRTGTAAEGIISGIAPNEKVVIDQLLSGTEFQVTEVNYSSDKYADPEKTVKEGTYAAGTLEGSDGQLILDQNAEVVITNILKVNMKVEKNWSGDEENTTHGSIFVGLYDKDRQPVENTTAVELNETNQFTYTFNDVREDDQIFELRPATSDEKPEFTVGGQGYVKAEADSIITAKANNTDTKYTVSYGDRTTSTDDTIGTVITQPITNTKIIADLNLLKVEKNHTETTLSGAEFSLYRAADDYTYQESDLVRSGITTDRNGKATVKGLVPGKYILKETKAPVGYNLAGNVWQVEVTETRIVTVQVNGEAVETKTDNDKTEFLIENTKIYSLPSAGGPGIYMFTISGVAFITAALLLFINNRRKEDEAGI